MNLDLLHKYIRNVVYIIYIALTLKKDCQGHRSKNTYNKSVERKKGGLGIRLAYHEYLKLIVLQLINISLKGYQKKGARARGLSGWLGGAGKTYNNIYVTYIYIYIHIYTCKYTLYIYIYIHVHIYLHDLCVYV